MADTFPASGNIEPLTFPHLLVDLHRHGATGSLKVTGSSHPKALYFRSGRILFGSSNDPQDQLGAILIEAGKITVSQLDEVNAKVGPGNPLAKLLAESGFVNQRELADAARAKVERILADVLSWESGTFEFEDGVLPKGAVDLKLSTEKLVLSSVQRIGDRSFALRHIDLSTVLEPVPEASAMLAEVRAEVLPLFEKLDGERTLREAIAQTRLEEFDGAKLACAMLFLGLVRKRDGEVVDLAREVQSEFGAQASAPFTPPAYDAVDSTPAAVLPEPGEEISFGPSGGGEPVGFSLSQSEEEPAVPSWVQSATQAQDAGSTVALSSTPAEPEVEPVPEPAMVPEPEPRPPAFAAPHAPSFTTGRPTRPETDTQPGDRPAYAPEPRWEPDASGSASHAEESQPPAASAPSAPASRPSAEDLAALDALLNPNASTRLARPAERPRSEKWEPQFRPPTTPPRRPPRSPSTGSSRAPVIAAAAGVALATVAAWYFVLRTPSTASPPTTQARATASPPATRPAPVTVVSAPTAAPVVPPPVIATPMPNPTSSAPSPAATPSPRPTPIPPPKATPSPPPVTTVAAAGQAPAGVGAARDLLRRGSLTEAARGFVAALSPDARGRFSLQVLAACAPDTVQKAVNAVAGDELFILPVNVKGRECYRLCWGVYASRAEAEAATAQVPAYFTQGGSSPRLQPLVELLP